MTWGEPSDKNGVIRGYIISYQLKSKGTCPVKPGAAQVKQVRSLSHLLDDLEPASTYEIRVSARTSETGPPSPPILITTDEARKLLLFNMK